MASRALARGLAALIVTAGLASAQGEDGPPADLLAHVKVGQRYLFRWTAGEHTHEHVWHVAEVHPGRVVYLTTIRLKQGERVLMETVADAFEEWTWGGSPVLAPAGALADMTRRRERHEAPGVKLDCVVTSTADGTDSWTAVKGDLETFPGIVRITSKAEGELRALVSCEEGPAPALPARAPQEAVEAGSGLPEGALDHVKVGQRWVFVLDNTDMAAETVWTVTEVHAAEGRVVYSTRTTVKVEGQTITTDEGEGVEWSAGGSPVLDPGTTIDGIRGARRALEVPGAKLDCYALTTDLADGVRTEVWTAVKGDHEVFPGPVKQLIGRMTQDLVRVEGP